MQAGEALMLVKTMPDRGQGGGWRLIHTITSSKASPLYTASYHSCCSRENPKSRYPRSDDGGTFGVVLPLQVIIFGGVV
jgi:hypothetical protein